MTDPKLVVSQDSWNDMKPELQARITYETVISLRDEIIELRKTINKPIECPMEPRIKSLEKHKLVKTILTICSGFAGGFGGSHIPK